MGKQRAFLEEIVVSSSVSPLTRKREREANMFLPLSPVSSFLVFSYDTEVSKGWSRPRPTDRPTVCRFCSKERHKRQSPQENGSFLDGHWGWLAAISLHHCGCPHLCHISASRLRPLSRGPTVCCFSPHLWSKHNVCTLYSRARIFSWREKFHHLGRRIFVLSKFDGRS